MFSGNKPGKEIETEEESESKPINADEPKKEIITDLEQIKTEEDSRKFWLQFAETYTDKIKQHNLASKSNVIAASKKPISSSSTVLFANKDTSSTGSIEQQAQALREKNLVKRAARAGQRRWRKIVEEDIRMPVHPTGDHSLQLNLMLNTQQGFKKSVNADELQELLALIKTKPFNHKRFNKPQLPYELMGLAAKNAITPMQLDSLLAYWNDKGSGLFLETKVYKILTADNQFTEDAKKLLIPAIQARTSHRELTDAQLNTFRLLLAGLPESERTFCSAANGDYLKSRLKSKRCLDLFDLFVRSGVILTNDATDPEPNNKLLFMLPRGMLNSLNLAYFGLKNYAEMQSAFGRFSIQKMEEGTRVLFARFGFQRFPNVDEPTELHSYKQLPDFLARMHDEYHRAIMASIGYDYTQIFFHFVDVVRANTHIEKSRESWEWIDAEFTYFLEHPLEKTVDRNDPEFTKKWCKFIEAGISDKSYVFRAGASLVMKAGNNITPVGILIFLDMVKNPKAWQELGIKFNELTGNLKYLYETVKSNYEVLKNDSIEMQVFKYQVLFSLLQNNSKEVAAEKFKELINKIDGMSELKELSFSKTPPVKPSLTYKESQTPKNPDIVPNRIFLFFPENFANSELKNKAVNQENMPKIIDFIEQQKTLKLNV